MERGGYIYILSNKNKTILYVGVTSNIGRRITEHKEKKHPESFTARYNVDRLLYFEGFHDIEEAIKREKQLKAGSRKKKEDLINKNNPEWNDIFDALDE